MGAAAAAPSQDGQLLRPGATGTSTQAGASATSSVDDEARIARTGYKFLELLRDLEAQLADPHDVKEVGKAYAALTAWTTTRQKDSDLAAVLQWLTPEPRYPAWRRQALEEAYRMFFDDAARKGIRGQLDQLPEPPNSEDIGFRRLPESLLTGQAAMGNKYSGLYEEGAREDGTCVSRGKTRWEYEISKNSIPMSHEEAVGREIALRDVSGGARANCMSARMVWLAQLMPDCCNRGVNGKEAAASATRGAPRPAFGSGAPGRRQPSQEFDLPAAAHGGQRRYLEPGGFREAGRRDVPEAGRRQGPHTDPTGATLEARQVGLAR